MINTTIECADFIAAEITLVNTRNVFTNNVINNLTFVANGSSVSRIVTESAATKK